MTPKTIVAFAIGPVSAALIGLITVPTIAWFFSQEDVGRMSILQVAISFSVLFFSLGLDQAYVREFHEAENKPALLKQALLPGFIILLVALILVVTLGGVGSLGDWLFGIESWRLSLLIALSFVFAFVSRFLSLVLRMNERGLAFSMSQVLPKLVLLSILGFFVVAGVERLLENLVLANTAAILSVVLVFSFNTRSEWRAALRSTADFQKLKRMIKFGLPMILGGVAYWGLTSVDKLFLRMLANFEELGVYSVSISFASAAIILQSVFSTVWAPTVYKWSSSGEGLDRVHGVSRYILAVVVLVISFSGLFSWVIPIFLPDNYYEVKWLVVSCLGYPLLYTLSESTAVGIGISKRTIYTMISAIIALSVNCLGNWLLIPEFGAAGAAVSTCFSFWIFFLLRMEFSNYLWQAIPRLYFYGYSALVAFGAITFTLFGEVLGAVMVVFWVAMIAMAFYTFKDEVRQSMRFLFGAVKRKPRVMP